MRLTPTTGMLTAALIAAAAGRSQPDGTSIGGMMRLKDA
jgi:hypothetical protein